MKTMLRPRMNWQKVRKIKCMKEENWSRQKLGLGLELMWGVKESFLVKQSTERAETFKMRTSQTPPVGTE